MGKLTSMSASNRTKWCYRSRYCCRCGYIIGGDVLINWTPNWYFGVFRTILLLHELWCKIGWSGAFNAKIRATKSRQNLSQRTHAINPIGPQTHILGHFGPFHYCSNFNEKWAKLVQLMHKFVIKSRRNFSKQMHPNNPIVPPNSCFRAFWTMSIPHKLRRKTGRTSAMNAQVRNEVTSEYFSTNAPATPHWTPNLYFGAFWTVSILKKPRCKMSRTRATNPQVMQLSHVRTFCNERTQSTPLDPKLMFWGVSDRFISARTSMQNGLNWSN
jgi:hypothetical protein